MRSLLPTAAWTRALLAPVLMFVATSVDRNYQTDFWHHLARGQAIAAGGTMVDHDLFTCTVPPEQSFQDANWLTQLSYCYLFAAGGLPLVQLVNSLLLTAMTGVVVWLCWRVSRSLRLAALLGAFTVLGLWQLLLIRPQTCSMFLFVVLYAVLELSAARRALLLIPPLLLGLWANLHGGFPIGLMLVGCYLVAATWDAARERGWSWWRDGRWQALGLCLGACLLATLANPYGWRVYQYVVHTSGVATARRIDEWLPPGLNQLVGKMWIASLLGLILLFALSGRRPRASEVCLVLCFLPLACGSVRMVAWWLLVCMPIAAAQLAALLPPHALAEDDSRQATAGTGLTFAVFAVVVVFSLPWLDHYNPVMVALHRTDRPESELRTVAERLRQHRPGGHIFTRFEWGEYLGWSLAPDYKVFMDGRIEIYSDRVWEEYSAITRGRADWQQILDDYGIDCLLLDTKGGYHADLLPEVERSPEWQRDYTSPRMMLFLRRHAVPLAASQARRPEGGG
jgi:hypothetical protein